MRLYPSDVRDLMTVLGNPHEIAFDTETSGLYADDGARVSTLSMAWEDPDRQWEVFAHGHDSDHYSVTWRTEEIALGEYANIVSMAWPFDQGTAGKPEGHGQDTLWPDAVNLTRGEWVAATQILQDNLLVTHNGKFDCEKMRVGLRDARHTGVELIDNLVWDTQNMCNLLWPLERTSLKPTCERIFGTETNDEAALVKSYLHKSKLPTGRWDLMPWDIIGPYADQDARLTLMLALRQRHEIRREKAGAWLYGNLTAEDQEARERYGLSDIDTVFDAAARRLETTKVLYRMERRGLPYDSVESHIAGQMCMERAAKVAERLPFSPTPNKARDFFFTDAETDRGEPGLNHLPYAVTDKGAPQLTAEIVDRMVADEVPYAEQWAEWKKATGAASMWYHGYADAIGQDGRLRTCFRQNGTTSTRFSVERVNLQAIPQDFRLSGHSVLAGIPTPRDLIASAVEKGMPGWRIYELDLAQAELRVAAMWAKCGTMIEMITAGQDLHTFTTQELFGRGPDDPDFDKWRQIGKRGNFSLIFGSGANTFRKMVSKETGVQLSDSEANRIVTDWNGLYPEFRRAIDRHEEVVVRRQTRGDRAWIDLIGGERRWFTKYEEAHKSFNQRVQSNLAQYGIEWMLDTDSFLGLNRELRTRAEKDGIGEPGLVLTIHDSQVLLLPDDEYGRGLAEACAESGRRIWRNRFPGIPGDVDYHAWMK